jgi:hypothetical protein
MRGIPRPTAWVPDNQVTLRTTPYRIVIDRETTHLALYDDGKRVFSSPAGIGPADDPRPTGTTSWPSSRPRPRPGTARS